MTKRYLNVSGCDDATYVAIDMTDEEFVFLKRVAEAVTNRGGGCSPVMFAYAGLDDPDMESYERGRFEVPA